MSQSAENRLFCKIIYRQFDLNFKKTGNRLTCGWNGILIVYVAGCKNKKKTHKIDAIIKN